MKAFRLRILARPVTVYNFEVDQLHNYYAGISGILVHNSCGGEYPWSSNSVSSADKLLDHGKKKVYLKNRSEAEELFLGKFQGNGYKNTTGMSGTEVKNLFGSKKNTYHWDDQLDNSGRVLGHGLKNTDGALPHLQIHTETNVIHIFFDP